MNVAVKAALSLLTLVFALSLFSPPQAEAAVTRARHQLVKHSKVKKHRAKHRKAHAKAHRTRHARAQQ
jgi:hypothetical protein